MHLQLLVSVDSKANFDSRSDWISFLPPPTPQNDTNIADQQTLPALAAGTTKNQKDWLLEKSQGSALNAMSDFIPTILFTTRTINPTHFNLVPQLQLI
ncbi:hypothetical protein Hypma_011598 [Hypsizygus marmoreus]|uniref:Uncharacterized protein n=1 Tax=Hypsizygus marmoreus TaxID=39966 RepID=A0A369JI70_HYPMA|nr:hypothetical protein Hypma_011598 [Hypsizygus marmoreus]